jgi:hypothetical protein
MKVLAGIFLGLAIITFCFSSSPAASKKIIPIYTPGAGGTAYFLAGAIATIVNKYVPEVQMMVEATGGTTSMVKFTAERYEKKQDAFSTPDSKVVYLAYTGKPPFSSAYTMLRAVTFLYGAGVNLVVDKTSSIRTYYDLKGKKVALGAAGSGTAEISLGLIEAHGISRSMFRPLWLSYKEVVEGIQDKSIDAGFIAGNYPIPAMQELSLRREIRVIPVDGNVLKKVLAKNPYFYGDVLKAKAYRGIDKDTPILVFGVSLATHSAADPDLVYKIVKALYEHRDELIEIHPVAKEMNAQSALLTIAYPLHPGAQKFFREAGILKKQP